MSVPGSLMNKRQHFKYVRNRDVKLTKSEAKKEQQIKGTMCDGICIKCIDKVKWRFQYNKYKPLKVPGKCKSCSGRAITKAYRTYCDACANKKQVCANCSLPKSDPNYYPLVNEKEHEDKEEEEQEEGEEEGEDEDEGNDDKIIIVNDKQQQKKEDDGQKAVLDEDNDKKGESSIFNFGIGAEMESTT